MADQYVAIQPDSTGKKVDCSELTVNAQTVERQRVVLADPTSATGLAPVSATLGVSANITNTVSTGVPIQAGAATTVSGSITTSTSTVQAAVAGYSHVGVTISGTYAAVNVTFEFSDDGGTTWFGMQMTRSDSSIVESASGSLTNTTRAWDATGPSCTHFRVRATAWTSGSATIRIIPSAIPCVYNIAGNVRITDATATNFLPPMNSAANRGFVTVTDGTNSMPTADAAARGLYARLTDGTNQAAVKAASTAAAATDPSLVVNISPNSPAHPIYLKPQTSGGLTTHKLVSAATTNATAVASGAHQLYNAQVFNNGSTAAYIKLSDATSVTPGTTAVKKSLLIPPGGGVVVEWANGIPFATGLSYCITGAPADTDTTAVAISQVIVNIDYI